MTYLDNKAIENLMTSEALPYDISTFQDQHFWHERVETLSGRRINFTAHADWKQTYNLLNVELDKPEPSFWNKSDNATVLEVLVSMGYSPASDQRALSKAASKGLTSIVAFLLAEGSIDPNLDSKSSGYTPLHQACGEGRLEVVKLLLADPRVDPDSDNDGYGTPLTEACYVYEEERLEEYIEIVRLLLADPRVDPTWHDSTAMYLLSDNRDNFEILELLLADGRADPSEFDSESLQRAAERGREKCVALLLADGRARPTDSESDCLVRAISNGHTNIVKLLLDDGRADPNAQDGEALLQARKVGNDEIIKLLLSDPRVQQAK
ncbi:Ankyrin repeat protein [uncultured virus]|nr:Ankyrin repeat protein [uncultured virus]